MTFALSVVHAADPRASWIYVRPTMNPGDKECIIPGMEGIACGSPGSRTRDCNIIGKNCDWCDIDAGTSDEVVVTTVGHLEKWPEGRVGQLSASVMSTGGVSECT